MRTVDANREPLDQRLVDLLMKITEIAFTGYSVTDMRRARAFYEGVLGLTKARGFGEKDGTDQWVEYDIGSGCLALIVGGKEWPPHPAGTAVAFEVDDLDAYVSKVKESGTKVVFEKRESPMCSMITLADPDGNWLVLHRRKPHHPDAAKQG